MTPWTAACQASLSITNSQSLLKLMPIELVIQSNHLILCHPVLPPSVFLSIRVFSSESVLHIRWPKYRRVSLTISPSNEYSGLISLAVQGTLKSLLQHHSSKHQFFRAQHSVWSNTHRTSLVAQKVKGLPAMRENQVQSLGQEDLLEKEMAAHSSILAWRISWMEGLGSLQSLGSQRHDSDMTERLQFH